MEENTAFAAWKEKLLDKITAHYRPHFSFTADTLCAGAEIALAGQMHNRSNRNIFGFHTETPGPQASEYLYVMICGAFDTAALARMEAVLTQAQSDHVVAGDKDQAFTVLSGVVLAGRVEADAARALKRHRQPGVKLRTAGGGWLMARIAVIDRETAAVLCDRDGKALRDLLRKVR